MCRITLLSLPHSKSLTRPPPLTLIQSYLSVAKGSLKHYTKLFWGVWVNRLTNKGKRDKIKGIVG